MYGPAAHLVQALRRIRVPGRTTAEVDLFVVTTLLGSNVTLDVTDDAE
jgi:hypothetical protein